MSTKKGNQKKGAQKYQNDFKFKHNKGSALTKKIKQSPLDKLCPHCLDIMKWKIDYRKYKPLSAPSRCIDCNNKTITKAYRSICDFCAVEGPPGGISHQKQKGMIEEQIRL
jgi:hypothetical protein